MGILSMLGGLGKGGGLGGAMKNLSSGLGSEGGMLQRFGMGQYGGQPMQGGLSSLGNGGLGDFLKQIMSANQQGSPPAGDQGGQPSIYGQAPGSAPTSLSTSLAAWLAQQRR